MKNRHAERDDHYGASFMPIQKTRESNLARKGFMQETTPILLGSNLHKTYRKYAEKVHVLRGVDLEVHEGDFVSVLGASGSGKSTMLHLLGLLDVPDTGR